MDFFGTPTSVIALLRDIKIGLKLARRIQLARATRLLDHVPMIATCFFSSLSYISSDAMVWDLDKAVFCIARRSISAIVVWPIHGSLRGGGCRAQPSLPGHVVGHPNHRRSFADGRL